MGHVAASFENFTGSESRLEKLCRARRSLSSVIAGLVVKGDGAGLGHLVSTSTNKCGSFLLTSAVF